jgi:flagellar protein FliO/FliZ
VSPGARRVFGCIIGAVLLALLGESVAAFPTVPSTAPTASESSLIRRDRPATPQANAPAPAASPSNGFDMTRVGLALGVVIVLIFVLRWCGRRLFPNATVARSTRAVQVVSRTLLAPRQQLMLVQVGSRLVVVGDSGGQMNALCEITDADEVAGLLGSIRAEKEESLGNAFGSLFRSAGEKMESAQESESEDAQRELATDGAVAQTREEVRGLMDKVRSLSRQFQRG